MKYYLTIFTIFFEIFCQPVDTKPPQSSITDDIRPRLIVNLNSFTPESRVYLRFWEDGEAYAFPSSYKLHIDAGGRLLIEVSLTHNSSSADILVYVDENQDGILDSADFGFFQSGIAVNNQSLINNIEIVYQTATLSTYASTSTLPSSGQKACVYMPPGFTAYDTTFQSSFPKFPELDISSLSVTDWFPVTILDSAGIVQSAALLSSWMIPQVNEVCLPI